MFHYQSDSPPQLNIPWRNPSQSCAEGIFVGGNVFQQVLRLLKMLLRAVCLIR